MVDKIFLNMSYELISDEDNEIIF